MPQDPAAALSALLRASSIKDHDEILKAANAAIKVDKTDVASQHTRIVALLKLDRFDDALRAIAEGGTKLNALCVLEQAYALYKTSNLEDATAALQAAGLEKRSFCHVAAQVAYRAERFDDARAIYSRLLDADDDADEENDLSINIRAAAAQSEWLGYSFMNPPPIQDSDGFEVCYNAACACIARGSLDEAANLLQRAIRLCDASDDLTQEDKEAEMRPILAQQAYVQAKTGKLKEALELYRSLASADDEDPDLTVIAQNNLLAMETTVENPYVLERKFATLADNNKASKLFNHQSNILRRNNLVVSLQASKAAGVKSRTATLLSQAEHPTTSANINILSVLNAAASAEGTTGKQLVRNLQGAANKRPNDVGLVLTIIQIQLSSDNTGSALSILESFLARLEKGEAPEAQDVRFSPGLVALAVALNRAQGRESCAKAELVKAATHWQARPISSASSLLEEAGIELMKSSNPQDLQLAGASFQKLFDEQQGSDIAAAGLVASLAASNSSAIQHLLPKLPPVETLIKGVNVTALLEAGVATAAKPTQANKRSATQEPSDKPNKRRRKIRLPKNYVEGTKPDPERWLPLRDRSSYRPKGKKGKKKAGETQGGMVKEEETLELVGGGGVKVEKAPPLNAKKKKKGKK
ncbi:signal recognition particle protein [Ilyonectria robusta]